MGLKYTMNNRSLVMVDANAKAKPANEALMVGVMRHAAAAAPRIAAERRLKRIESHRLTEYGVTTAQKGDPGQTYLPTSSSTDSSSVKRFVSLFKQRHSLRNDIPYRRILTCHVTI